nr:hypothetical protein [uncultured Microbacterium sp.]
MIRRRLAAPAALSLGLLVGVSAAAPAWAAPSTEVIQGAVLKLVSVADWNAASSLLPGEPVQWDVTVSADAPDPGTVTIGVSAVGDAPLVLDASRCEQEWTPEGCPSGAEPLRSEWEIERDGAQVELTRMPDTDVAHLRLSVALSAADDGGRTEVRLHAQGAGESVVVGPGGELATTGMAQDLHWWFVGGGGLIVLGALGAATRGRHRAEAES